MSTEVALENIIFPLKGRNSFTVIVGYRWRVLLFRRVWTLVVVHEPCVEFAENRW